MMRTAFIILLLLSSFAANSATIALSYAGLLENSSGGVASFQISLSGDGILPGQANYNFGDATSITASAVVDGQAVNFDVTGYGGSGNLIQSSTDASQYVVETYPYFGLSLNLSESITNPGVETDWLFQATWEDGMSCSSNPYNCEFYSLLYEVPVTNSDLVYDNYALTTQAISFNVVPVPAAVWLFGSALAGLGWMRRKQTA
jgi:hypothetical protein